MKYNAAQIQQHQASRLLNQNYANTRENILGDGLKLCRRAKAFNSHNPNTAQIALTRQPDGSITAAVHDVVHCGNAHLCAYCSSVKVLHMQKWIKHELVPAVNRQPGMLLGLLTLTASHKYTGSWIEWVNNYFLALAAFAKNMRRIFNEIGCIGRARTFETPVGSNGLHGHIHDLFTYHISTDIAALKIIMLSKWKAALAVYGLHCSDQNGVDIQKHGDFDPLYIAKEIAAHDTKDESKSDLKTLWELLNESARGNKRSGREWVRAARAIQGRDRWNVGQLAHKLEILSPSDWCAPKDEAKTEPVHIIEYPQSQHMTATESINPRAGLAFILRSARNEFTRPGGTHKMVLRMCDETVKGNIELIKRKYAIKLAEALANTKEPAKTRLVAKYYSHCTFAIADYTAKTQLYMFPVQNVQVVPASVQMAHIQPNADLVFM